MKPQTFLRGLCDYWPVISQVWQRFESRSINEPDLLRLLSTLVEKNEAHLTIYKLVNLGILNEFKRGGRGFEINAQLTPLIQNLLNQQSLGLLAEITAHTDQLDKHLHEMHTTLIEGRRTAFFEKCRAMQTRFQTLRRLMDTNTQAIQHLVDQAKQAGNETPLSERYEKVIEAWDHYVAPALQMRNPGQPFDITNKRISRTVQEWLMDDKIHLLSHDDARYELEVIQYRQLDFKDMLEGSIDVMARQLAPLVKKARISTQIAHGAAIAFRNISGYERDIEDEVDLRLPGKKRKLRKPDEDALAFFYTQFMGLVPDDDSLLMDTRISMTSSHARKHRENIPDMIRWLTQNRPVEDVVGGLLGAFPESDSVNVLSALNLIIMDDSARQYVLRHDDEHSYQFNSQIVRMHRRSYDLSTHPLRSAPLLFDPSVLPLSKRP